MPNPARTLLLASALCAAACNEWVPLAREPEVYPLETALRICRSYADRGGERGPVRPGTRIDPATYNRLLRECMHAQGWVLRRKVS